MHYVFLVMWHLIRCDVPCVFSDVALNKCDVPCAFSDVALNRCDVPCVFSVQWQWRPDNSLPAVTMATVHAASDFVCPLPVHPIPHTVSVWTR